jgi:hypothetical protein
MEAEKQQWMDARALSFVGSNTECRRCLHLGIRIRLRIRLRFSLLSAATASAELLRASERALG